MIFFVPTAYPFLIVFALLLWYFPIYTLLTYFLITWVIGFYDAFSNRVYGSTSHVDNNGERIVKVYKRSIKECVFQALLAPIIVPIILIFGIPPI